MKTITIAEFETLVARDDWQREQEHEITDRFDITNDEGVEIWRVTGWASQTSILDDIKITYTETFGYDEYEPDSLSYGSEGLDDAWSIEGVTVIDDDGDEMSDDDLADYLSNDFSVIDYSGLDIEQVVDVDVDRAGDMDIYTLKVDNAPRIRFSGELIASASSSDNRAMGSSYSGVTGRWTELELYKTKGGKFVCHTIERTRWQGERDRCSGKVCDTIDDVIEFFGQDWLAQELYDEAKIDNAIEVE